jgi:hypothetical protein
MASPVASAALKQRVRRPSLWNKLAHPEDLIKYFPHGSYIGWSGFTGVGYVPLYSPICGGPLHSDPLYYLILSGGLLPAFKLNELC